jgi:hypothetical protein
MRPWNGEPDGHLSHRFDCTHAFSPDILTLKSTYIVYADDLDPPPSRQMLLLLGAVVHG